MPCLASSRTPLTAQIKESPDWYDSYAAKSILGRWAMPHEMVGMVLYLAPRKPAPTSQAPSCWSTAAGPPQTGVSRHHYKC